MHIAASGGTFAATIKLLLRRWKCFHGVNEILNLFIESIISALEQLDLKYYT